MIYVARCGGAWHDRECLLVGDGNGVPPSSSSDTVRLLGWLDVRGEVGASEERLSVVLTASKQASWVRLMLKKAAAADFQLLRAALIRTESNSRQMLLLLNLSIDRDRYSTTIEAFESNRG